MFNIKLDKSEFQQVANYKLNFGGTTKTYITYRIPINKLYLNDHNTRIATAISEYYSKGGKPFNQFNISQYNKKIREFILESDSKSNDKKTKEDIKRKGQEVPGVVLEDGRIIDGNRRFSIITSLNEETGDIKYAYFEAVILDNVNYDNENDKKAIKLLELEVQLGKLGVQDYNPIDLLVDYYENSIKNKLYTDQEFARITNKDEKEVRLIKNKAEIMGDFLSFWNVPNNYFIARDLKLDGPFQELASIRKKMDTDEWMKLRIVFYTYLIQAIDGATTLKIRAMGKLYESNIKEFEKLFSEFKPIATDILLRVERDKKENSNFNIKPTPLPTEKKTVTQKYNDIVEKNNKIDAINKPIKTIEDMISKIESIDNAIIAQYDSKKLLSLNKSILILIEKLKKFIVNES